MEKELIQFLLAHGIMGLLSLMMIIILRYSETRFLKHGVMLLVQDHMILFIRMLMLQLVHDGKVIQQLDSRLMAN